MTKEEWNELVRGICNQKIKPKLRKIHREYHPLEWFERFPFGDRGIYTASRTIKFINENFDDEDDLAPERDTSQIFKRLPLLHIIPLH